MSLLKKSLILKKFISILLKLNNSIWKTTSMLNLVSKKVFSNNRDFSSLSFILDNVLTISNISKLFTINFLSIYIDCLYSKA